MKKSTVKPSAEFSERSVKCDFCPTELAHLYVIEMTMCQRIVASCSKDKKQVEALYGFQKWLEKTKPMVSA
jgi:hypothetical protein